MSKLPFEFLVFSDIHFHEYQQYSTINAAGINDRLLHCSYALKEVVAHAVTNNIRHILFGGDLCHTKKNVTKETVNLLHQLFNNFTEYDVTFHMIPGNHDYTDKKGMHHSLESLSNFDNVIVYDNPEHFDNNHLMIDSPIGPVVRIAGVPYTEDKAKFIASVNEIMPEPSDYKILLAHTGIQGARVGSDYVLVRDHDLDISEINYNQYDICLFGHYHEHQKVFHNGWIIGATHEHVWSDAGGKRGFLHVKLSEDAPVVTHIPTPNTIPKFKVITSESDLADVKSHDFIKYKLAENLTEQEQDNIRGFLAINLGSVPAHLDFIPVPKVDTEMTFSEKALSADTILEEWVEQDSAGLDKEKLLTLGKQLLAAARDKIL